MSEAAVYDRLQAFLTLVDRHASDLTPGRTPLTRIVRDHQRAPSPSGPYAVIEVLADRDGGLACRSYATGVVASDAATPLVAGTIPPTETRVIERTSRHVEWLVQVLVYATDAVDRCRLFVAALSSEQANVALAPLAVSRVLDVKRSPELVGQVWEGRAAFELELAGLVSSPVVVDTIDSGTVTFDRPAPTPDLSLTFARTP